MKYFIYFLMISFSFTFSQNITWSNTIPLSTIDNGIVQLDTDDDGNIYIAGYDDGPKYCEWESDSMTHLVSSKLIKLNRSGELILEKDYGNYFNDGIKGISKYEDGLKIIGNNAVDPWSGWWVSLHSIKFLTTNLYGDTISTSDMIPYFFRYFSTCMKSTESNGYMFSYNEYGTENCYEYIIKYDPQTTTSKKFPTELSNFVPDTVFGEQPGSFYIYDFDTLNDNTAIISGMAYAWGLFKNHIIKLDRNFDVEWQLWYPNHNSNEPDELAFLFNSIQALTDSTYLATCWVDINNDEDNNEDEFYLTIIDKNGEFSWVSPSFDESVKVEKMSHKDFILQSKTTNTIWKYRFNGSGMDLLWTEVYPDLDIFKVTPEGFINATIIDDELFIYMVKDDTSIDNEQLSIDDYILKQNYPNPFNPATTISYTIPEKGLVQLKVYNTYGEIVSELVNKEQNTGMYNIEFKGNDLNSGIYFYQLKINNQSVDTKRMLLIK